MAIKKNGRRHSHYTGGKEKKRDTARLSARLAPPEEKNPKAAQSSSNNGGAIIVDTGKLKLPSEFTEKEKARQNFLNLEPVVIVILFIALTFIAFIAWQISLMEPPGK